MKILILLLYYDRPKMVVNALESILDADKLHQDWHLTFIDDSSPRPGYSIVASILNQHLHKITFMHTGGHKNTIGRYMTQACLDSSADIGIMLCDDDALCHDYLHNLSEYYDRNPYIKHAYCKLKIYNPAWQKYHESITSKTSYNKLLGAINPRGRCDASQVSWRIAAQKMHNLKFTEGITKNLDYYFFRQLNKIDKCHPMDVHGQYKGEHPARLFNHDLDNIKSGKQQIDVDQARQLSDIDTIIKLIDRCVTNNLGETAKRICADAMAVFPDNNLIYTKYQSLMQN